MTDARLDRSSEPSPAETLTSKGVATNSGGWRRASWIAKLGINKFSAVYVWAGVILLFSLWIPGEFLTHATFTSIASNESVTVILAFGVLIPLSAGQYDLSAAQTLGLSSVICTLLIVHHQSPEVAALTALVACVAVGIVNALLITVLGINSFIATLGTSSVILGVTELVTNDQFIGPVSPGFQNIAIKNVLGVPVLLGYVIVLGILVWAILEHTSMGRRIYATGANPDTARLVGVRVNRYIVGSMVTCAVFAGVAGILLAAQVGSVSESIGPPYLLPVFAGCFLGTTQIKLDRFNVWGTLIALFLLATGEKGLQLVGGASWVTDAFNGVALILAVGLSATFQRRQKKTKTAP